MEGVGCPRVVVQPRGLTNPIFALWIHPLWWDVSLVGVEWIFVDLFMLSCRFNEVRALQSM